MNQYILKDCVPVLEPDILAFAKWFHDSNNRILGQVEVADGIRVSTIFLGFDHQYGRGEPVLWETMVFGGKFDQEQVRYSSDAEARSGHIAMVERVKETI